jgi:hypothetical protein
MSVRSDDKAHWHEVDALSLNFRRHWREGRGALHRDHGLAIDQRRAGGLINVFVDYPAGAIDRKSDSHES